MKFHVPYNKTTYHDEEFSLPKFDRDMYLIGFEILIDDESKDVVHHMDIYEGDLLIITWVYFIYY